MLPGKGDPCNATEAFRFSPVTGDESDVEKCCDGSWKPAARPFCGLGARVDGDVMSFAGNALKLYVNCEAERFN
jgi:hypothetical protein